MIATLVAAEFSKFLSPVTFADASRQGIFGASVMIAFSSLCPMSNADPAFSGNICASLVTAYLFLLLAAVSIAESSHKGLFCASFMNA